MAQEQVKAPEIEGSVWFNAGTYKKINIRALYGKVVLLFFWTSHDANSDAVISIVNKWYALYRDKGLEVVGVYSADWFLDEPESELFKKIESRGMKFPIVIDDDSSLRYAYEQQLRPSFCLVDRGGWIRSHFTCDYTYRDIEKMMRTLLEESVTDAITMRSVDYEKI